MNDHISDDGSVGFRVRPGRLLHVYRGKARLEHVSLLRTFTHEATRSAQAVQLIVLQPRSIKDAPDAEFRAATARFLTEQADPFIASAVIVRVDGFLGAVARSVMTGLNWVGDLTSQRRNFGRVDEAAAWLAACAPTLAPRAADLAADLAVDVDELVAALDRRS